MTTDSLATLVEGSPIDILSERSLNELWDVFSELHHAGNLIRNDYYLEKFVKWVLCGDDGII